MSGGAVSQLSIRKALGAIKDSTTIGLAKVNSEYKVIGSSHLAVLFHFVVKFMSTIV